jgi:hypothetical protein
MRAPEKQIEVGEITRQEMQDLARIVSEAIQMQYAHGVVTIGVRVARRILRVLESRL